MWGKLCFAFLVTTIGGMMQLNAQSTVDDSASCDSSTFDDEAVKLIREDLKDVKHVCASNQQQCPLTESSNSKEALVSSLSSA